MTALTRLIREKYLRKSSQPIKLGTATAILVNPTMDQSRHNHGDTNDDDQLTTGAAATLRANLKK